MDHLNRDFPWASTSSGTSRELSFPVVAATFVGKCLLLLEAAVDMLELEVLRGQLCSVHIEDIGKVRFSLVRCPGGNTSSPLYF